MTWIDRLLRRRRIHDDLADEIRAHLEEKADELMARGMSPREAREAARRAFGNVTGIEERGREVWQWPTIESVVLDIRYALHQMRRAPALSASGVAGRVAHPLVVHYQVRARSVPIPARHSSI